MINSNTLDFLEGIIEPLSWDRFGHIKRVGIYTNEGEDIVIENTNKIPLLKKLFRKTVKIVGKLHQRSDGEKSILITRIRVVA